MPNFISAIYHPELLTVEYIDANGDHLLRSGGTIAWRFNNPGNLRPGSKYTLPIGSGTTKSGKFLIFPTVESGRTEKKGLLLRKYKDDSVSQMMEKYAPRSENDTDKYVDYITSKSGVDKSAIVGDLSEPELTRLMQAMEKFEGFNAKPETRKETWVRTTKITLSDGARPLAGHEVTIKQGDQTRNLVTDNFGQLPAIAHLNLGEQFELWTKNSFNEATKIDAFTLGSTSQSFTYFKEHFFANALTRSHVLGDTEKKKKPGTYSYVVQPGDTLGKISKKFRIEASQIQEDNQLENPDKIFPGQRLSIYGKGQQINTSSTHSKTSTKIPAILERSREGQGHPLAVTPSDQKRAPWMEIAVSEAKRFSGAKETTIQSDINYHTETGAKFLKSMTGTNNA